MAFTDYREVGPGVYDFIDPQSEKPVRLPANLPFAEAQRRRIDAMRGQAAGQAAGAAAAQAGPPQAQPRLPGPPPVGAPQAQLYNPNAGPSPAGGIDPGAQAGALDWVKGKAKQAAETVGSAVDSVANAVGLGETEQRTDAGGAPSPKPSQDQKKQELERRARTGPPVAGPPDEETAKAAGPPQEGFVHISTKGGGVMRVRRGVDLTDPASWSDEDAEVFIPGSAGRPGGWVPVSRTKSGGYGINWGFLEHQMESSGAQAEAMEQEGKAAADALYSQAAQASVEAYRAGQDIVEERKALGALEEQRGEAKWLYDQYSAQVDKAEIDPDRIYAGDRGKTRKVFHTIGMALGAFGASITKSPNYAVQLVNNQIERDIRSQEAEIAKGRKNKEDAMQLFMQRSGSVSAAKEAVRALQNKQAALEAQKLAAVSKVPEVRAKAAQAVEIFKRQEAEAIEKYMIGSVGQEQFTEKYLQPVAGRASSSRPLTMEERKGLAGGQIAGGKFALDKDKADRDAAKGPGVPKSVEEKKKELDEIRRKRFILENDLAQVEQDWTDEGGKFNPYARPRDLPGQEFHEKVTGALAEAGADEGQIPLTDKPIPGSERYQKHRQRQNRYKSFATNLADARAIANQQPPSGPVVDKYRTEISQGTVGESVQSARDTVERIKRQEAALAAQIEAEMGH